MVTREVTPAVKGVGLIGERKVSQQLQWRMKRSMMICCG